MKKGYIGIVFAVLLGGCTSVGMNASGTPFAEANTQRLANFYIYRPDAKMGSLENLPVKIDDKLIGSLKNAGYLARNLSPGYHALSVWIWPDISINSPTQMVKMMILISSTKSTFVRADIAETDVAIPSVGYFPPHKPKLELMPLSIAIKQLQSLRRSE